MKKIFMAVRDVDEEVFRKFRAYAIARKMKIGEAIRESMKETLKKEGKRDNRGIIRFFGRLKNIDLNIKDKEHRMKELRSSFSDRLLKQ